MRIWFRVLRSRGARSEGDRLKALSWIFIAVLVSSTLMVAMAQNSSSRNKPNVGTLRKNLKSVEQRKAAVARELRQTRRQTSAVMADIEWVDREVDKFESAIEHTTATLAEDRKEQQKLASELKAAEKELDQQQQQLRTRLRNIYMRQSEAPVSALLKSRNLGDLAVRKTVLERIANEDRELFEGYKVKVASVAEKKRKQDQVVARIANLVNRQRTYKAELGSAMRKKQGYLGELRERASDLSEQYAELDRESDAIASRIRAFQARPSSVGGTFRGGFIRPSRGRISSGFGMRFHPVLRRNRMHNGIDIAAPTGTPIVASAAGIVIEASYMRGYGNTVIVDHGGGVSTLYAHCSRIFVREGQRVRQGERIAAIGSTGLSTGPHLHFEIRINGRPVNPMSRL